MATKLIYFFGKSKTDGSGDMKSLLGGKGANLAQMTKIGLPVPSGFTITTEVCVNYYKNGRKYPAELSSELEKAVK
jgi:pyruvate,orthophosphate dikinase